MLSTPPLPLPLAGSRTTPDLSLSYHQTQPFKRPCPPRSAATSPLHRFWLRHYLYARGGNQHHRRRRLSPKATAHPHRPRHFLPQSQGSEYNTANPGFALARALPWRLRRRRTGWWLWLRRLAQRRCRCKHSTNGSVVKPTAQSPLNWVYKLRRLDSGSTRRGVGTGSGRAAQTPRELRACHP